MNVQRRWLVPVCAMMCFLTGACAKKAADQTEKAPMTRAQRDSAIAASKLPGAGVLKKTLEVADSAKVRANQPIPQPR